MKYCVIVLYFYCLVVEDDGPFFSQLAPQSSIIINGQTSIFEMHRILAKQCLCLVWGTIFSRILQQYSFYDCSKFICLLSHLKQK